MKVPFVDFGKMHKPLMDEFRQVFERVLEKNSFILGPEVVEFEKNFAAYVGADHCLAISNGTAALEMVLRGLEVGPGDEVITVTNTFIATAEAISATGARPVLVDCDPVSYNMDPSKLEAAITPRTKVILPVHLYGQTADMDKILAIANAKGIAVVEDACQAHGATYKGKKAGTMGVAGCFSFYPGKNLGALGEGGGIVTNNAELALKIKMLRDHGSVKKYEHRFPGFNTRLEGLQGGFLNVKLKHLDGWNEGRRKAAKLYESALADSGLVLPKEMPYGNHVFHLYIVQCEDREAMKQALANAEVETGLHYPTPLHLQEAYADLGYKMGDFPVAEKLAGRILSLPMFPHITKEMIEHVASVVMEANGKAKQTAAAR